MRAGHEAERTYRAMFIEVLKVVQYPPFDKKGFARNWRIDGTTLVAAAIYAPVFEVVQWLVCEGGIPIDAPGGQPHEWNALQHVCALGFYRRAHMLLNMGANPLVLTHEQPPRSLLDLMGSEPPASHVVPVCEPIDYSLVRRLLGAGVEVYVQRTYTNSWYVTYQQRCHAAQQAALALLGVGIRMRQRDVFGLLARFVYDTRHLEGWEQCLPGSILEEGLCLLQ